MKPPEGLPPLPGGAVYLGRSEEFRLTDDIEFDGWYCSKIGRWQKCMWVGNGNGHYAAPADSEIARLNGAGKPSWDDAPEWAEWLAQDSCGAWFWYEHAPRKSDLGSGLWRCGIGQACLCLYAPANPNWRETLERRPESESEQEGHSTTRGGHFKAGGPVRGAEKIEWPSKRLWLEGPPDIVIPKDAADAMCGYSWVEELADAGYRLEIDSNGIRGWKEDSE